MPDLPDAAYRVWVRGYGLVDSEPVTARPGESVTLEATQAATPQEAAAVYPANYWYSLLEPPAPDEFPGYRIRRKRHLSGAPQARRRG